MVIQVSILQTVLVLVGSAALVAVAQIFLDFRKVTANFQCVSFFCDNYVSEVLPETTRASVLCSHMGVCGAIFSFESRALL